MNRRLFLQAAIASAAAFALDSGRALALPSADDSAFKTGLAEIERSSGGRLGVALLDTASGNISGHRTNERFPMCSTFKLLAVAAVLCRVDQKRETLDRLITFERKDLLEYAPVTSAALAKDAQRASLTVAELCSAAITLSDNTAANLLLSTIGGPSGVTAFARTLGDDLTRLDRNEPTLNDALPNDPRDTTTPAAMAADLRELVLGDALSKQSREQLSDWLIHNKTGDERLRAGLPKDWKVGDKTGSGQRGTTNDIAVIWPPQRPPLVVAAYLTGATADGTQRNAALASVARLIANGTR